MTQAKYNRIVEIHEELKELNEHILPAQEQELLYAKPGEERNKAEAAYAASQNRVLQLLKEIEKL